MTPETPPETIGLPDAWPSTPDSAARYLGRLAEVTDVLLTDLDPKGELGAAFWGLALRHFTWTAANRPAQSRELYRPWQESCEPSPDTLSLVASSRTTLVFTERDDDGDRTEYSCPVDYFTDPDGWEHEALVSGRWVPIASLRERLDAERAESDRVQLAARARQALQGPEALSAATALLTQAGYTVERKEPAQLTKEQARAELRTRVEADEARVGTAETLRQLHSGELGARGREQLARQRAATPEDKGTPPSERPELDAVLAANKSAFVAELAEPPIARRTHDDEGNA